MTKKAKEYERLVSKKTLSSDEAVRLLKLAGWRRVHHTMKRKKPGTSHQYFESSDGKYETCVPDNKNDLSDGVRQVIQKAAKYFGE